jgi:hypothetical protein
VIAKSSVTQKQCALFVYIHGLIPDGARIEIAGYPIFTLPAKSVWWLVRCGVSKPVVGHGTLPAKASVTGQIQGLATSSDG